MVEITLVRHGQANAGAQDEESYDRLSDLGRDQAAWLGAHFAEMGHEFDLILSGTLNRQRDTAQAVADRLGGHVQQDPRLNEMDYFGLSQSLKDTHALDMPTDREGFIAHLPQVIDAWERGQIHSHLEPFAAFQDRINAVIALAEARGGRVLLVTSGGVIGMAMRLLLGLETRRFAGVLLQIHNSSVHRFVKLGDDLALDCFNALPHLDRPERRHARTYI